MALPRRRRSCWETSEHGWFCVAPGRGTFPAEFPGLQLPQLRAALGSQERFEGLRFRIVCPDPGTERLGSHICSCTEPAALRQDRQEQQDGVSPSAPWMVKVDVI